MSLKTIVVSMAIVTFMFASVALAGTTKIKNSKGQTVGTVQKTGQNQYNVRNKQGRTTAVVRTNQGGKGRTKVTRY